METAALWGRLGSVIAHVDANIALATKFRAKEFDAAVTIQRHYRGSVVREALMRWIICAVEVYRSFRGYLGRRRALRAFAAREARVEEARLGALVTTVQAAFRGYYSRKYVHSMSAIRDYLLAVEAKGRQVKQETLRAAAEQRARLEASRQAAAERDFLDAAEQLHHLVSTKSRPGVFNPPYAGARSGGGGGPPTAFGLPVEDHIKERALLFTRERGLDRSQWPSAEKKEVAAVRRALRDVGGRKPTPAQVEQALAEAALGSTLEATPGAAQGGLRDTAQLPARPPTIARAPPPYADDAGRVSLRASEPYDAAREQAKEEQRYEKYRQLDPRPFAAGGKVRQRAPGKSVRDDGEFVDTWRRTRLDRAREFEPDQKGKWLAGRDFQRVSRGGGVFEDQQRRAARDGVLKVVADVRSRGSLGDSRSLGSQSQSYSQSRSIAGGGGSRRGRGRSRGGAAEGAGAGAGRQVERKDDEEGGEVAGDGIDGGMASLELEGEGGGERGAPEWDGGLGAGAQGSELGKQRHVAGSAGVALWGLRRDRQQQRGQGRHYST